jgi:photosystem II stability/assembly factor-like uncharacterized protein
MKRKAAYNNKILFSLTIIIMTINVQGQWIQLNSDTTHDYSSIFFLNPDTGFICGSAYNPVTFSYDGVIVRTLDGGTTWDTTHMWPNLMDIYFINDSIGFTGGQDGVVYKTVDMGSNWSFVDNIWNNNDYSNLYFINQDTGLFQDYIGIIFLYTPLIFPTCSLILDSPANIWYWGTGELDFNQNIGYFTGGNGVFAKSFDQGISWNYFNCDPSIWAFDAKMTSANHIVIVGGTDDQWIVGDTGKSTVSFNGGSTWSAINQFANHDIVGVDFYDDFYGYCVGGINSLFTWTGFTPMGSIYYTSDGGMSWILVDSTYNDQLKDIFMVNDSLAYAAGNNGYILKNSTHFSTLGIPENDHQIYVSINPNPAKNFINININTSEFHLNSLSILDISGRLMKSIVLAGNENNIQIDTESYEEGIYFIRVENEQLSITRKFIKVR